MNVCTRAACDGAGNCDQNALFPDSDTLCPDTDGNLCTKAACDGAGHCDQSSPDPDKDGDPCPDTDGNECTIAQCDGGVCDQNAPAPPGTSCGTDDGNPCTRPNECIGTTCVTNIPAPPGTPCGADDGNPCTRPPECIGTTCVTNIPVPNGTSCDDRSACTDPDSCQGGSCVGSDPVVCTALDQCHDVGICDPATGVCSDPPLPDGTACDDGDECTYADTCQGGICIPGVQHCRVSISKKGSLLFYSKIELRFGPNGSLRQDAFLTIVNDYPEEVFVQWYFINGDEPLAAVFAGDPLVLTERAHRGWNSVDCTTRLTEDESSYMSMATGRPLGCQPFRILDPGVPPGRPDPDGPSGERVIRGYVIAFAVDNLGHEINWNHLSGHVTIVNYNTRSAWEYNAYAFQCVADVKQGSECESGIVHGVPYSDPGTLHMDGLQYDFAFDKLLFDFYSVGSLAFSLAPSTTVMLDTDLTLYPVSVDLRTTSTNTDGPVLTRAKFDVWNQNEDAQSGVNRCITCWDQTLLSNYDQPNSFLIGNIQTNKGKARIDGIESDSCDAPGACCNVDDDPDCTLTDLERIEAGGEYDRDCSENAALLGVSDKILAFSGAGIPAGARTDAGTNLVGQGVQKAVIKREIIEPPDPFTVVEPQDAPVPVGAEPSRSSLRPLSRGQRTVPRDKR